MGEYAIGRTCIKVQMPDCQIVKTKMTTFQNGLEQNVADDTIKVRRKKSAVNQTTPVSRR
jgi:hypothetical protein